MCDRADSRIRRCLAVDRRASTDAERRRTIREDRIDILVDLTMHMGEQSAADFRPKAGAGAGDLAGYPGTTGLSAMDYRLTDPYLDPPGLNDQFYSETSIRLPDSFWCYDPLVTELAVNSLPAQTHGHITFGCLNNFCKVNEQVLRLWARVLKIIPRSRLMLLCPEGEPSSAAPGRAATRGNRSRSHRVDRPSSASAISRALSSHRRGTGYLSRQRPHHEPRLVIGWAFPS